MGLRKGLQHAHTNARESVLQDTVQQGKRPLKGSWRIYRLQGRNPFAAGRQKIAAKSLVF
jgi:hypothetical protein